MFKLRSSAVATIVIALAILLSGSGAVMAVSAQTIDVHRLPITFTLNGESKQAPADQQGFIYQDRIYIPLRFVSEALQLQVDWNGAESLVRVNERTPIVSADSPGGGSDSNAGQSERYVEQVTGYERPIQYEILGQKVTPDLAPHAWIINERLYVPLRFLAETAGATVHWQASTYTAIITLAASEDPAEDLPSVSEPDESSQNDEADEGSTMDNGTEPHPAVTVPSGPSQTSERSIIRAAEAEIESLRSACENDLWRLALRYLGSESGDRQNLLSQGEAKLAECDREFAAIMSELAAALKEHGYDTSIVSEYERRYEEEKATARNLVDQLR